MKAKLFWLGPLLALPLAAQTDLSTYQGPGILSPGVGDVGERSGQQVDLRFWAGANAIYDTNVQPLATDAQGNLVRVPNLLGTEVNLGAYGSHHWQHAMLGLSYVGSYREYPDNPAYNGTSQSLTLGYTVQYSNHIVFDLRASGATLLQTAGVVADTAAVTESSTTGAQLFDTRASFVNISGSMTYIQSPRTSYTFGAGANSMYYQTNLLTDYNGYSAFASATHRVSLSSTIGGTYSYAKQSSPDASFTAQSQSFLAQYFGTFGRFWTLNLSAGATISQVHQLITLQVDPLLVELFGFPTSVVVPFDLQTIYPSGSAELKRQFQRATLFANYTRGVGGGNGFYLTTRNEMARAGVSYTGFRKGNVGVDFHYQDSVNLGAVYGRAAWYGAGAGFTYGIFRYTSVVGRFDIGHFELGQASGYRRTTERATIGLGFSPGEIPLSLW